MPNITLKINGLNELIADAKRAGNQMSGLLYQAMVKATTIVQEDAKRIKTGSFKNQTGNLRRSINRRVESAARGVISTDSKYATYVEEGTRPHVIVPIKNKMLAFKINGKMVFARSVHHPGSRPYPFMRPAMEDNVDQIQGVYDQLAKQVVNTLAGK